MKAIVENIMHSLAVKKLVKQLKYPTTLIFFIFYASYPCELNPLEVKSQ